MAVDLGISGLTNAEPIGSGRFAVVYRAFDSHHDRSVAVKVLPGFSDETELRRFARAQSAMARVSKHEGIVTIHSSGINERGEPFLVMTLLEQGTMQDRIEAHGAVPWPEAVELMRIVARTVDAAHQQHVIHLGLRPANIMLTRSGYPLVSDFGIARHTGSIRATASILTAVAYSPPEVLDGAKANPSADTYGLGATLFALIAGSPPFVASSDENLLALVRRVSVEPVRDLRSDGVPDEVCAVIERAMAKGPADRYVTAADFALALDSVDAATAAVPDAGQDDPPFTSPHRQAETRPPQDEGTVFDADVQFTVYRPRIVASERWYQLLAFAHKTTSSENEVDASDPLKEVARLAAQALGAQSVNYGSVAADSSAVLRRGNELVFEPWLEAGRVEPSCVALTWNESVHQVPFRFQVPVTREGGRVAGGLRVFGGPLLLGEMNFQFSVSSARADPPDEPKLADTVRRYRRIFASYSHSDADLVRVAADFARLSGDEYLIDSQAIRSGEEWERRLEELIEEADIFQLFWSHNAMRSEFVRKEWEYALGLGREEFIRPVFWQDPLPRDLEAGLPPADLLKIHFHALPTTLAALADEADIGAAAGPTVSSPVQSIEVPVPAQAPGRPLEADSASLRRLPGASGRRTSESASICFSCGEQNPRDQTFCKRCGTHLAPVPMGAVPSRALGLRPAIVACVAAVGLAAVILTLLIAR